ncbi:MAG: hypothetical protein ACKVQA_20595 [Burkholderiales bacterium]
MNCSDDLHPLASLVGRHSFAREKAMEILAKGIWNLKLAGTEMVQPGEAAQAKRAR